MTEKNEMNFWERLPKAQVIMIPVRIRALMQACKMQQHDLVQATGLDKATISHILCGRMVARSHETVKIADAFKHVFPSVTPEDLFEC